jgi:hypothetical protein
VVESLDLPWAEAWDVHSPPAADLADAREAKPVPAAQTLDRGLS